MTKIISTIIATLLSIAIVAVIGGTVVWLLWDYTIPYVFPKLVSEGYIAGEVEWWKAVMLSWICYSLINAPKLNNSDSEK